MVSFSSVIICFTVYSFLGWVVETLVCSILARRYISRGLLRGPFCMQYGFAAVAALLLSQFAPLTKIPLVAFVACTLLLTALKFVMSWLVEKLLGIRLWDVSKRKLNIAGRIFWPDLLIMGLLGSTVIYLFSPNLGTIMGIMSVASMRVTTSVLLGFFILSASQALSDVARLQALLKAIQAGGEDAEIPEPTGPYAGCFRLINAYPKMQATGYQHALDQLHHVWDTVRTHYLTRLKEIASIFTQKTTDAVKEMNPFAHGLSIHKLIWVFAIGCVLGYLIETAFCLITRGIIESRQGMVYGPFNQVYGIGAVLLTLCLQPLAKRGDGWIFAGGAIIGGGFEYIASWVQEKVLGTVSWEYSDQAFSFGGRTSLLFMFFWGILGVVYIRQVYPRISSLIERIPKRQGVFFSWVIVIVLTADMAVSFMAVNRWTQRQRGVEPRNACECYLDERFPDAMMEEIYPSMMLVGKDGERPSREGG